MSKRWFGWLFLVTSVLAFACKPQPKPKAAEVRPAVIRVRAGVELIAPPEPLPAGARAMRLAPENRGVPGDLIADIVLGQPDFASVHPNEVVSYRLHGPDSVREDPSRTHVWISDFGNNRLMRLDLATGLTDRVIGQPDFATANCNGDSGYQNYPTLASASASSLCGVDETVLSPEESINWSQPAFDAAGALYVADVMNNRVLKYCNPDADTAACDVWGQPDFSSRVPPPWDINTTATTDRSLRRPQGVVIEPGTGAVFVVDNFNSRIVADTNGDHVWDLVIGHPDFATGGYYSNGSELNQLGFPVAAAFCNGRLYVADGNNRRVMRYAPPYSSGMAGEVFLSGIRMNGITADPFGRGLWITNCEALLYGENSSLLRTVHADGGCIAGGVAFNAAGEVIATGFIDGTDVVRFPSDGSALQRYFNPGPTEGNFPNHVSSKGMMSPTTVEVYGDQMIVASFTGLRAYNGVANVASWMNNRLPDVELRVNNPNGTFGRSAVDSSGRLYLVNGATGHWDVYQLPLTPASVPFTSLGRTFPVLGGGSVTVGFNGLAISPAGDLLYLADDPSNRIVRIRNPLTAPVVDVVYGQLDSIGTLCNRGGAASANTLCHPGGISLAPAGQLYVGDIGGEAEGNGRMLRFAEIPSDGAAVVYAPAAEKIFPKPQAAFEMGIDEASRLAVGFNPYVWISRFPGIYDDPFGASDQPSRFLQDYTSWPQTHTFFGAGHLAQADGNRHRVLIYLSPLGTPIGTPTPTNTPASETPMPTATLTPVPPTKIPITPPPTPTKTHGPKKTPPGHR